MASYRIPDIICFRCPLYNNTRECEKAMRLSSTVRTRGVCGKIEYDINRQHSLYGDPQDTARRIMAGAKKTARAARR